MTKYLTVKDAARELGCAPSSVHKYLKELNITPGKVGLSFILPADCMEKLQAHARPHGRKTLPTKLQVVNLERKIKKVIVAKGRLNQVLGQLAQIERLLNEEEKQLRGASAPGVQAPRM